MGSDKRMKKNAEKEQAERSTRDSELGKLGEVEKTRA